MGALPKIITLDSMADTNGTTLASHTGQAGATWARPTGVTGTMAIQANRACASSPGTSASYYASGVPTTAEYVVNWQWVNITTISGNFCGVWARLLTTAKTGYFVQYEVDAGNIVVYTCVSGSFTQLGGAVAQSLGAGVTLNMEFRCLNAAKEVWVNGSRIYTDPDNSIVGIGRGGVDSFAATTSPTSTTGLGISNFLVTEARTRGLTTLGAGAG